MTTPDVIGKWEPLFQLKNVACHASLLPDGKRILYWGRRKDPQSTEPKTMIEQDNTNAFILDLSADLSDPNKSNKQTFGDNVLKKVNLFCSGHCWMTDGRLIVFGGHIRDGIGWDQACIFDPKAAEGKQWIDLPPIKARGNSTGRWYPTALCLKDGSVLCISGSGADGKTVPFPVIWRDGKPGKWLDVMDFGALSLYPHLQLDAAGRVFMSGPQAESRFLDLTIKEQQGIVGGWVARDEKNLTRTAKFRDYAASVMYEPGKVLYMGGGNDGNDAKHGVPTNIVELIDLTQTPPKWNPMPNMNFRRRQHNGTILPDGTILVTGGTKGEGFNNVGGDANGPHPVHTAELFVPSDNPWNASKQDRWIEMAKEDKDRCYHGVALLLPDGRVFSAGSGEWSPDDMPAGSANRPQDSHTDAQIFSPPYLNKGGPRGEVVAAPNNIDYNTTFDLRINNFGATNPVKMVSLMRTGSVTHSNNMSQSRRTLTFDPPVGSKLTVTAPTNDADCVPGYYMVFVLDSRGVPAVRAPIVRLMPKVDAASSPAPARPMVRMMAAVPQELMSIEAEGNGANEGGASSVELQKDEKAEEIPVSIHSLDDKMEKELGKFFVTVGLTASCPYGLGPCWGGAHEALHKISDVAAVRPKPSQTDAVAFVYLKKDKIPDIDVWRTEFSQYANGTYIMRGLEMTFEGTVAFKDGHLLLIGGRSGRGDLLLAEMKAENKVQRNRMERATHPMTEDEAQAFKNLKAAVEADGEASFVVTGPLIKRDGSYTLEVRLQQKVTSSMTRDATDEGHAAAVI